MGAYVERVCTIPGCKGVSKKRKAKKCPECGGDMETTVRKEKKPGNPRKVIKRFKFPKKKRKSKWMEGEIW